MNIYIMRHGEAGFDAPSDPERPLTELGRQQSLALVHHYLPQWQELDLVLVSPYVRTWQTWEAMRAQLPETISAQVVPELVPETDPSLAADVIIATAELAGAKNVLVVSHMPLVGYLISQLVPGQIPMMFATAAVAHVQYDQTLASPSQLLSHLAPHDLVA
ncbi:phosphohistidine phosphatase SixA [Ferrimonas gelatinilytica]|uniref:Phosphohistidine phosphatase SixA n=1 Tax=Ferrimonas gelatinilytica TaxID=1255257 RepID=A0ABP9S4X8_9GAMM